MHDLYTPCSSNQPNQLSPPPPFTAKKQISTALRDLGKEKRGEIKTLMVRPWGLGMQRVGGMSRKSRNGMDVLTGTVG